MTGTRTALPLRVIHRGWNTFGIATLTQPDGSTVPRALEDHGEAACVLPYDPERRVALLVRQSRVGPAFWGEPPALDEAPAGGLDGGEPEETAIREAMEEAGLRLARLEPVAHAYSMPSVSSERLWLYLAPYTQADRVGPGGGLPGEGEQVEVLELPLATLAEQVRSGHLADLKTLVLVQALMLRRPELFTA
ncbi:nudix-type nucleoside diphosphatase (YffH/AdpP family) [Methylobacterium brachiatum]|jgi:nudix-type nucleoside diphosphatase (YffH/AdpP family)|uniref:GDP-mannose pyrophosphatase n=1 Tax=Methylobacterium brachiatum TaxID=269660 RepID=A0AAJ1WUL0_9HYPH|nr:NUDIX hydrolase [Methylobacterium brachiatum]MCB4801821.1 NUDIX hydrolase [Methylobacterium brachiatum]MDQ0542157.1 nudix-type nucleoside diphosphatase (YffH/AdpP family) [Methylobacterium brachiatum]